MPQHRLRALGPSDMPSVRASLIESARSGLIRSAFERMKDWPRDQLVVNLVEPEFLADRVEGGSLWWIKSDAVDLVAQAAPSLPIESSVTPEMAQLLTGASVLIGFSGGIECNVWADGAEAAPLEMLSISLHVRPGMLGEPPVITMAWFQRMGNGDPGANVPPEFADEWMLVDCSRWRCGEPLDADWPDMEAQRRADPSDMEDRRLTLAILALALQDRVIEHREHLDRPTRRRAQRAGRDPRLDAVRIHDLRGAARAARTEATEQAGRYRHRWIVEGHWRSQPYGPQSSLRRPVWIAPHMKGPEGAPVLTGEKVKVMRP